MSDSTNTQRKLINETYTAMKDLIRAVDTLRGIMESTKDLGTEAGVAMPQTIQDAQAILDATGTNMPAELFLKMLIVGPYTIQMLHTPHVIYAEDGTTVLYEGLLMPPIRAFGSWTT